MKRTDIIILGVNGNCIDIADSVEQLASRGDSVSVQGFLDDDPSVQGTTVAGYPVLGRLVDASRFPGARFVCGIGSPRSFHRKPEILKSAGVPDGDWVTIIHPAASVSRHVNIGAGVVLLAGCVVGARVRLGQHVMVLQNSTISHDSVIGDSSVIATGVCVSGMVTVGSNCYLGSNCSIREGVRIGDGALVGIGAAVIHDVGAGTVVVGNPARPR